MGQADYYAPGDWNVQCYECGRKYKASMLRKNWQGYWVCPEHWEPRQPQDFARSVIDYQTPPWQQPWPAPLIEYVCSWEGRSAWAGVGEAGCMISGRTIPFPGTGDALG